MKVLESALLNQLYHDASGTERLRSHYMLHASHAEKVQRLLIAMLKGSYVEPHYHELPHQWEMFILLRGKIRVCLYSVTGAVSRDLIISENDSLPLIQFFPGDIHSVECLSDRALLLEVKEGPFEPQYAKILWKGGR
ncbi:MULTISPECIES: WbuC family cupin fold metalloprotein [Aeromonas]|uniref:WbuC family cupin fold metalloprotein n=1 Tax=Aeromonas TaxID=642 RepID=UPI0037C0849C